MRQTRIRQLYPVIVALGVVVALAGTTLAQSTPSDIGTWELNVAKSTMGPNGGPKSTIRKMEMVGDSIKLTIDAVGATGGPIKWTTTFKDDGKTNPVVGNSGLGNAWARTRVDANTTKTTYSRDGVVTVTDTSVVSPDGKTWTVAFKGVSVTNDQIYVFDRK